MPGAPACSRLRPLCGSLGHPRRPQDGAPQRQDRRGGHPLRPQRTPRHSLSRDRASHVHQEGQPLRARLHFGYQLFKNFGYLLF
eukprot:11580302-Heterocapsa_arctica.AAC.1